MFIFPVYFGWTFSLPPIINMLLLLLYCFGLLQNFGVHFDFHLNFLLAYFFVPVSKSEFFHVEIIDRNSLFFNFFFTFTFFNLPGLFLFFSFDFFNGSDNSWVLRLLGILLISFPEVIGLGISTHSYLMTSKVPNLMLNLLRESGFWVIGFNKCVRGRHATGYFKVVCWVVKSLSESMKFFFSFESVDVFTPSFSHSLFDFWSESFCHLLSIKSNYLLFQWKSHHSNLFLSLNLKTGNLWTLKLLTICCSLLSTEELF